MASKAATLRQAYSELAKADAVGDNEKALRTCNRSELRMALQKYVLNSIFAQFLKRTNLRRKRFNARSSA
jgi:hypothetical protein